MSRAPHLETFVQSLWHVNQQSGQYRYHQQCVYLLGLRATAGRFQHDWASAESSDGPG